MAYFAKCISPYTRKLVLTEVLIIEDRGERGVIVSPIFEEGMYLNEERLRFDTSTLSADTRLYVKCSPETHQMIQERNQIIELDIDNLPHI